MPLNELFNQSDIPIKNHPVQKTNTPSHGEFSSLDFSKFRVSGASDLEFGLAGLVDLDGNGLGVLPSGLQEEIFDFGDLLRHA